MYGLSYFFFKIFYSYFFGKNLLLIIIYEITKYLARGIVRGIRLSNNDEFCVHDSNMIENFQNDLYM